MSIHGLLDIHMYRLFMCVYIFTYTRLNMYVYTYRKQMEGWRDGRIARQAGRQAEREKERARERERER